MKNEKKIFKIIFSLVFATVAALKIFNDWFNTRIDSTVIALILLSFLPWILNYLKSIEAFGMKAEFISNLEKEKIDNEASKVMKTKKIEINETSIDNDIKDKSNYKLIYTIKSIEDPLEKIVLMRYEIEKNLKDICNKTLANNVYLKNIRNMADELCAAKIILPELRNLIYDLIPILNRAVHADISIKEYDNVQWVIKKGMFILLYLNDVKGKIIKNKDKPDI